MLGLVPSISHKMGSPVSQFVLLTILGSARRFDRE